eukprot:986670-Pyramimonas_sp.AAC.1
MPRLHLSVGVERWRRRLGTCACNGRTNTVLSCAWLCPPAGLAGAERPVWPALRALGRGRGSYELGEPGGAD